MLRNSYVTLRYCYDSCYVISNNSPMLRKCSMSLMLRNLKFGVQWGFPTRFLSLVCIYFFHLLNLFFSEKIKFKKNDAIKCYKLFRL